MNRCPHCGEDLKRLSAFASSRWRPYECPECGGLSVTANSSIIVFGMAFLLLSVVTILQVADRGLFTLLTALLGLAVLEGALGFACQVMSKHQDTLTNP